MHAFSVSFRVWILGSSGRPAMTKPEASPTATLSCCSCGVRFAMRRLRVKACPAVARPGSCVRIWMLGVAKRTPGSGISVGTTAADWPPCPFLQGEKH